MELTLFVVCLVLVLALVACAFELYGVPHRRQTVRVHLRHREGILSGQLWSRRGDWLVVKDAQLHRDSGESAPADGEILLDKAQVAFIQVLL